jgi:hypothetical protein
MGILNGDALELLYLIEYQAGKITIWVFFSKVLETLEL